MTHEEWIRRHVEPTGPIEQPREFPWSVVLRVPTADGIVWFKENVPPLAHELAVIELLARRRPELLPELVAADRERGWMLMRHAGIQLRHAPPTQRDWELLLPLYADLQLAAAADADALVAAATPDRRLARLPALFREAVAAHSFTDDERRGLTRYAERVDAACAELGALGVPESIQHDDLHDDNVFVEGGRYRVLDWGDSSVSHPFASLLIPFEMLAEVHPRFDLDRLRDAYLEPFTTLAPLDALRRAVRAANVVAGVTRALKWAPIAAAIPRPHRWEDAVPYRLRILLDERAPG